MKMKDFDITMTQYNRGDIVTGTIVMITENRVIVALGGLKEGTFPKDELDAPFKVGDAILVMVTGQIDDNGLIVLTCHCAHLLREQLQRLCTTLHFIEGIDVSLIDRQRINDGIQLCCTSRYRIIVADGNAITLGSFPIQGIEEVLYVLSTDFNHIASLQVADHYRGNQQQDLS